MKILAGDIGGTKTTLAIFEVNGTKLVSLAEEKYPSQEHASLTEIVQKFDETHGPLPEWGSFGIAGPVRNGVAQTTNLPWNIDAKKLETEIGFNKVAMKPGKPTVFGWKGRTFVFGLPGNPVSTIVSFQLFVRPLIRRLLHAA